MMNREAIPAVIPMTGTAINYGFHSSLNKRQRCNKILNVHIITLTNKVFNWCAPRKLVHVQ